MQCPSCKTGTLSPSYLEGLFPCQTCADCGGYLVMLSDYLLWLSVNKNPKFVSNDAVSVEVEETSRALICPITGGLMTKYRISQDTDHRLDLSPTISAIWMDKGEWELLKSAGLAGKLNNIFTDYWQRQIGSAKSADVMAELYQRKFGEHYAKIKEFREMLETLDDKSAVLAYLTNEDPYEA